MAATERIEREYLDLVCPECGGVLHEVTQHGQRQWYCLTAIGEVYWNFDRRRRDMVDGALHGYVKAWNEGDGAIKRQLEDYRSFVVVGRRRAA